MTDKTTISAKNDKQDPSRANQRLAYGLVIFVGCMVGMAYASVPLYQLFCQVTGYGGTTQEADAAPVDIIERNVTVRFDANVSGDLNWRFKPSDAPITLKVGETGQASYQVVNLGASPSTGTATFNVTPQAAGIYFNKLECFCFTEQTVKSGETVDMPVIFFVDPDIDKDPNMASIKTITLSYTFFPKKEEEEAASFDAPQPETISTVTGVGPKSVSAGS
ncbi:cytochrome c oxidase assembly protein [Cohaesibacter celericrescens]|uniref:cytochrome c oxidase assembly protein n=1 Tax=Cohaesibacter celericrescens TaxID=2067669 RepID=UPI003568D767